MRRFFPPAGLSLLLLTVLAAPVARAGDGITFTVATYNIQARPFIDDYKTKYQEIPPHLNAVDIVGLQECLHKCPLIRENFTHPHAFVFDKPKNDRVPAGSGLALFSKFPVTGVKTHYYEKAQGKGDVMASKGVLLLRLDIDGMAVDVYNTHMNAGGDKADPVHLTQVREAIAFVRENSPLSHSVIFVGDFNMRPPRLKDRAERGKAWDGDNRVWDFQELVEELALRDTSDTLFGPVKFNIDRILFRAALGHELRPLDWRSPEGEFVKDGDRHEPLSDHPPVIGTFVIRSRT